MFSTGISKISGRDNVVYFFLWWVNLLVCSCTTVGTILKALGTGKTSCGHSELLRGYRVGPCTTGHWGRCTGRVPGHWHRTRWSAGAFPSTGTIPLLLEETVFELVLPSFLVWCCNLTIPFHSQVSCSSCRRLERRVSTLLPDVRHLSSCVPQVGP